MKIWKTLGYLDMDHDGDVDSVDAMIYDDMIEEENASNSTSYYDDIDDDNDFDDSDDDDDDFDDSDDDDDDNDDEEEIEFSGIYDPLSYSPKRVVQGPMKYFDGEWHFFDALVNHFPELQNDYSGDEDLSLGDFFIEMSEVSPEKTAKYWKWLMDTFTPQILKETNGTTGQSFSNEPGGYVVGHTWDWGDKQCGTAFLEVIKEEKYFRYVFEDSVWEKHDTIIIANILNLAFVKKEYELIKKIFNSYLRYQKSQYTNRDVSEIWQRFLINVDTSVPTDLKKYIQGIAEGIGEFGRRITKYL